METRDAGRPAEEDARPEVAEEARLGCLAAPRTRAEGVAGRVQPRRRRLSDVKK